MWGGLKLETCWDHQTECKVRVSSLLQAYAWQHQGVARDVSVKMMEPQTRCILIWIIYIDYLHKNAYIHTYIHTYVRTYIQTDRHTYIHTDIHTYRHTYIHTYTLFKYLYIIWNSVWQVFRLIWCLACFEPYPSDTTKRGAGSIHRCRKMWKRATKSAPSKTRCHLQGHVISLAAEQLLGKSSWCYFLWYQAENVC